MLLLSELLESGDLKKEVERIASEFRQKHGLGDIQQLGIAVPDVEAAAEKLEAAGIGPFFISSGSPEPWLEKGSERKFRGKLGVAYKDGVELELLEPGEGSDFYWQGLDEQGRPAVHHIGLLVNDVDTWASRLEEKGYKVWVRGRIKAGPLTINFCYIDTTADAGILIEFISWSILGFNLKPPAAVVHLMGRLERWSGKRSISM